MTPNPESDHGRDATGHAAAAGHHHDIHNHANHIDNARTTTTTTMLRVTRTLSQRSPITST